MLHIFISGFRASYRVAALNAICAPMGTSQKFTFSLGKNIEQATIDGLSQLVSGTDAFITFVDRYAPGGYRYIPIRRAKFVSVLTDAEKVEVEVSFREWPRQANGSAYSNWVAGALVPQGAPRLVGGNPDEEKDGQYVIVGAAPEQHAFSNGDGWRALVDQLSETRVFRTSEEQATVFARVDILEKKANKSVPWNSDGLQLGRGTKYRLRIDYVFPLQQTDKAAALQYKMTFSPGLEAMKSTLASIGALARAEEFPFAVAPMSHRSHESVQFEFSASPGFTRQVWAPKMEILIATRGSAKNWLAVSIIGLLWVLGTGIAEQTSAENSSFQWGFYVAPLIQYIAIVAMFRVFGMKLT